MAVQINRGLRQLRCPQQGVKCRGSSGVTQHENLGHAGADAGGFRRAFKGRDRDQNLGPCIQQPSYEVDDAFEAEFVVAETFNARFFRMGRNGHAWFDLSGYVVARLLAAGVTRAARLDEDTYTQPDRFFSFRRATHNGEPGYGRQISVIGLRG